MVILAIFMLIIFSIWVSFLLSAKESNVNRTDYTPKFDYEIYSETNKQIAEERKQTEDFYKDAEFVNKKCTSLEDFIINDEINFFDLRKLADLNNIHLQIPKAWYPLTIELIKELNTNGWNKKVYCIKEKYATLEFYTAYDYNDTISKIIRGYGYKSQRICQTCGEKGEIRNYSGWEYVDCRKHYLENRGKITVESTGFSHKGVFYNWEDIKGRSFEDLNFYGKYNFLLIELNKTDEQQHDSLNNKLYISKNTIGFGNFLNYLSNNFPRSIHSYIVNFEHVDFCEICGYQSVYFDECECCENSSWEGYLKKWGDKENSEEEKYSYMKRLQMDWISDEGEKYEYQQKNYSKNPNHKILFSEAELQKYSELDDFDDDL
jgi:hypothetical protein